MRHEYRVRFATHASGCDVAQRQEVRKLQTTGTANHIKSIRRFTPGDRLYHHFNQFFIFLDMHNASLKVHGNAVQHSQFELEVKDLGILIIVPLPATEGAIAHALNEVDPVALEIMLVAGLHNAASYAPPKGLRKQTSSGLSAVTTHFICGTFILFFEPYLDWIRDTYGKDPSAWPGVLNFARVIRNAAAHKCKIHMTNPAAGDVQWHSIKFGPTDHGKTIIPNEFPIGNLMALMLDVSDFLDGEQAPIL